MIKISCENCGKKYKVDETRMKMDSAKVKCSVCKHTIVVVKPEAVARVEPEPEPAAAAPPGPEKDPREAALEATLPTERMEEEAAPPTESKVKEAPAARGVGDKTSPAGSAAAEDQQESLPGPEATHVRFGLAAKVIIVMLFVSLAPFCLYWGFTFKKTEERIRNDTELLMTQIAVGLGSQVDEWLDKNFRVLKTAADLEDIISMDPTRQEPILKAIRKEYPWTYLVFTVGLDGMNVARDDGKPLKNYVDRIYYQDIALNGKQEAWQTLFGRTSKKPSIVISVPIKDGDELVGVMCAGMTIDAMSKLMAKWKRGKTGFAFLVDEKGKVVAHQVKEYVVEQKKLDKHPLIAKFRKTKKDASYPFENDKGNDSLGRVKGIKYGWALAIQQETDEVFAELRGDQLFAMILLAITVVAVALIAWLSARAVVKPIQKLTDAAERMSLGEMDVKIDVQSKDEVGLLAQAINRMQLSLKLAMNRLRARR